MERRGWSALPATSKCGGDSFFCDHSGDDDDSDDYNLEGVHDMRS